MLLEADIPATQSSSATDAWIPHSNENGERAEGPQAAESKGPAPSRRLAATARDSSLRNRRDFQHLYDEGNSFRGGLMVLILAPNGRDDTRRGFVASRKVGNAVARNRCKRLLREAYRRLRGDVDLQGLDLILVARSQCAGAGIGQVVEELHALYRTAGRTNTTARNHEDPVSA